MTLVSRYVSIFYSGRTAENKKTEETSMFIYNIVKFIVMALEPNSWDNFFNFEMFMGRLFK